MDDLQWEEYLKHYYQQKELEKYQQRRTLSQPKTTNFIVLLYITILLVLVGGFVVILFVISPFNVWINTTILILYIIAILESYGRLLAVKIVECYQHYASEEKRRRCKCIPSCSEYAISCFKKYELFYSLFKIRKRLFVTCKGFEYIIDEP